MERRDELIAYLCKTKEDKHLLVPVIDELLFLERQMAELKKLPFIKIHPNNPELQKATPAAKQYKELLQQYTNLVKVLEKRHCTDSESEESLLHKWIKQNVNSRKENLDT